MIHERNIPEAAKLIERIAQLRKMLSYKDESKQQASINVVAPSRHGGSSDINIHISNSVRSLAFKGWRTEVKHALAACLRRAAQLDIKVEEHSE